MIVISSDGSVVTLTDDRGVPHVDGVEVRAGPAAQPDRRGHVRATRPYTPSKLACLGIPRRPHVHATPAGGPGHIELHACMHSACDDSTVHVCLTCAFITL